MAGTSEHGTGPNTEVLAAPPSVAVLPSGLTPWPLKVTSFVRIRGLNELQVFRF